MGTPLENAMSRSTDQDLYDILHVNRMEYSEEAIAAAETELNKRNLAPARLEELQVEMENQQSRATEPLSDLMKIVLFMCGLTCFGIPLALVLALAYRGADRKSDEAWRWTWYGVTTMIMLNMLCLLLLLVSKLFVPNP
jgi:hypothetical protein